MSITKISSSSKFNETKCEDEILSVSPQLFSSNNYKHRHLKQYSSSTNLSSIFKYKPIYVTPNFQNSDTDINTYNNDQLSNETKSIISISNSFEYDNELLNNISYLNLDSNE